MLKTILRMTFRTFYETNVGKIAVRDVLAPDKRVQPDYINAELDAYSLQLPDLQSPGL
jgi:hypothetical protein